MPKVPSIRAGEVVRVALSIGFVLDRQKGSHAVYYRAADSRRVVIPMHGTKDLKPGTLRGIINDLGLTVDEFNAKLQ
jgi:predicted RNA binding protein YcfA (HicA-like mRNA interferase family)